MKKHQTNCSSFQAAASLSNESCACDEDNVIEELQQLRTDTEKALKASWDEIESLQNECNSRLHQFIRLEVELRLMQRNEIASKIRIDDLKKQRNNTTSNPAGQQPNALVSTQTGSDTQASRKRTWPLRSLPIFKSQRDEAGNKNYSGQEIISLVQTVAERDKEIQEKQRVLEETLDMIKRASNGIS